MNENADSFNADNSFEELKQKAKADSLKRQNNISMIIRELGIREKLQDKLEEGGIFLAGLSILKEIDILYLFGACSGVERLKYFHYEKKYVQQARSGFEEVHIYDKDTGKEIDIPNVHIEALASGDQIPYEEVSSFAENFGVSFDISNENLLLAKEIKRTAFLFEMLKTNVHNIAFPYEDGLPFSNWYDKSAYEQSENKILQNLICLLNTLKINNEEVKSFLNSIIYLRILNHVNDLRALSEKRDTDIVDSYRMKYTAEFFNQLIPATFDFPSNERFILLYFSIQKVKAALRKYQDKDVAGFLLKWLDYGVKKFEAHIPDNFKNLKVSLPSHILNESFYRKKTELKMQESLDIKQEENIIKTEPLTLYDDVFSVIDKQMKEHDESLQENWKNDLKLLPPQFHGIYKLVQLSDVYSFYALGIINKNDLQVLTNQITYDFTENAFKVLEQWFNENVSQIENDHPELVQGLQAFQEAKQGKRFDTVTMINLLEQTGMTIDQINKLAPSTKEALTNLLKEDFDKNISLALKFKKEMFNLVKTFREAATFLIEKMLGVGRLSLDLNLPLEKCTEKGNLNLTKMNRLMLCCDILYAVQEIIRPMPEHELVYEKIKNLMAGYYLFTLQKIQELTDDIKQPEQSRQMKELYPFYDAFNVPVSILETEKDDLPFLLEVARFNLKSFTNSKATQDYYLNWFDYAMDFSEAEKVEIKNKAVSLPKYIRNPHLTDSMHFEEQRRFLKDMADHYFTESDQKANHYDKRVAFGICTDVDLLYAMGVLSPFEYDKVGVKHLQLFNEKKKNISFFETCMALQEEEPPLKIPLIKEVFDTMEQIKFAGRLLDYSFNYENLWYSGLNYNKQEPETTVFDFNKNPLKAEGKLIDTMLMLMKDLSEYNLEESKALRQILNSYWKESVQGLNDLSLAVKKKYPEMAKRILDQRGIFGIKEIEQKETISNRFKYYPKLFSLIRQTLEKEYKYRGGLMKMQNFFEKEIKAFVEFYGNRAPILKDFVRIERERE